MDVMTVCCVSVTCPSLDDEINCKKGIPRGMKTRAVEVMPCKDIDHAEQEGEGMMIQDRRLGTHKICGVCVWSLLTPHFA